MRLLISHPLVVTLNDQNDILEDAALVIHGKWIRYVGPSRSTPPGPYDRTIDASRMICVPGFINAHCHSPANLRRGLLPGRPLEIWLFQQRSVSGHLEPEDYYASALLGAMEMLKTGTTTVLDHFPTGQAVPFHGAPEAIQAMRDLGIRHLIALTLSDKTFGETLPLEKGENSFSERTVNLSGGTIRNAKSWLSECERFIREHHNPDELTSCCPGPSAVHRCSDELLLGAARMARQADLPLHMHLAETFAQKVMGGRLYGTSLVQHLRDLDVLGPNLSLAHCVWIDQEDIDLIAHSGAVPVHNPASNLRLGSGLAPVPQLLSSGVQVALGTDGAASNDGQNMFDAIRLAGLIHNPAITDYESWITPLQALRMATRGGAQAVGLPIGTLTPGRLADIVLLKRDTPSFIPLNDVVRQLVFCENGSSVDTVIVNGVVVVEQGRLVQMREERILEMAEQSARRSRAGGGKEVSAASDEETVLRDMYFRIMKERKDFVAKHGAS